LADALAEYVGMTVRKETVRSDAPPLSLPMIRSRGALWVLGLVVLALIAGLAFGAYRQPDLLLNLIGLRYCG